MGFVKNTNQSNSYLSTDIRNIFVGRAKEVNFFIREILQPEDPAYNIVSLWGIPGVGKSTLLSKFIDITHEADFRDYCLTAQVDDRQVTPSSIMEKFADQFRIAGYPFIDFEQAMHSYNNELQNLRTVQGTDRKLFLEEAIFDSTNTVLRNGLSLHEYSGEQTNPTIQNFEGSYLYRQLFKDVERKFDPIANLTKAFISDLRHLADSTVALSSHITKHSRRVLLFFDEFEQLADDVIPWLLNYFLEADISSNIVLVVAGHMVIERSIQSYQRRWQKYKSFIYPIPLDSFTEVEAHDYFRAQGINDPNLASTLMRLSHGLPYSLSLLTSNPNGDIDITQDVSNNFLRTIPEYEKIKRKLALEAALLSRPFNQDDLKAFTYLSEESRPGLYRWLCDQPFVRSNPLDGRPSYREPARDNFSRLLYRDSPDEYRSIRAALVHHYQQLLDKIQSEVGSRLYKTVEELELVLALTHQLLLLPDEESHINAIEKILEAYKYINTEQEGEVLRLLRGIGEDEPTNMANKDAQQIAGSLIQYIETSPRKRVPEFLAATSFLIKKLSPKASSKTQLLALMHRNRGNAYVSIRNYEQAFADFDRSIEYNSSSARTYISRAQIYVTLKEFDNALTDFDQAFQLDANNEALLLSRGQAYLHMKRYEDALHDFEQLSKVGKQLKPFGCLLKGLLLFNNRKYEEASDALIEGLMEDSEMVPCWTLLAQVYEILHPSQEIPRLLKTLSVPKTDSVSVMICRAEAINVRHHEEACAELTHIIELEPYNIKALIQLGIAYGKLQRYEEALSNFTLALELDANNVRALKCRGFTYHNLKRYTDALHDYNSALGHQSNDANVFIYRSNTYRYMRQFKDALKELDRAMKLDPNSAHLILEKKGDVLQAMGRDAEALNIFIEALNIQQNCLECWLNLAKEYGNLHPWGEIPRLLREVKVLDEKDASVIACRGTSMFYMNCYKEALIELNLALEIDPDHELALLSRSRVYKHFNMYQKALQDLDSAITLNKYGTHELQEERGENLQELGKNEEACDTFIEALKIKPTCYACWSKLIVMHEFMEGRKGTTQWLKELSVSGFGGVLTLSSCADALRHLHYYEEALQVTIEALDLWSNDFTIMMTQSRIYSELKYYEKAQTILCAVLRHRPDNAEAILSRGWIYYHTNNLKEALKDFELAMKLDLELEHEGQKGKGAVFYSLQRYQDAASAFSNALKVKPTCSECWFKLTLACEAFCDKSKVPGILRSIEITGCNEALAIARRAEAISDLGYYQEALQDMSHAFALDETAVDNHYTTRGLIFSYLKHYAEAIECYNRVSTYNLSYRNLYNIAVVMVRWNNFPSAQKFVDAAYEALLTQTHTINRVDAIYGLGGLEALSGNSNQALSYLRQAISFSNSNKKIIKWAKHDIAWLELRSDKRFQVLISNQEQEIGEEVALFQKGRWEQQNNANEDNFFDSELSNKSVILKSQPLKVFLCYSPDDRTTVQNLYLRLKADGIDPWLDEKNLLPGQNRDIEIQKAVRSSDAVIVCLSSSAQNAGYIHKHILYALDTADEQPEDEIFIIPAKLGECLIPERLSQWQPVNLQDEEGYERLIKSLQLKFPK